MYWNGARSQTGTKLERKKVRREGQAIEKTYGPSLGEGGTTKTRKTEGVAGADIVGLEARLRNMDRRSDLNQTEGERHSMLKAEEEKKT